METAAVLIAPEGASGPLRGLMDRLASVGVVVTICDELATAVEMWRRHPEPPAMLLDLRGLSGEVEDLRRATETIRRLLAQLPTCLPIGVTIEADARVIVACMRAGAADVIDIGLEGTATARSVVQRICQRQRERSAELDAYLEQRAIIEELLKDLIRTERRSIDAEQALTGGDSRAAAILLVEHDHDVADELADRLENAGIATYAYVTGEEALREAEALARTTGLDLALVAAQLPGIDGLETVRQLRARLPGLPAFLMTSVHDVGLAEEAADLGVVGFVQKPLADFDEVVARLSQLADDSLARSREHGYLERIKERHERVLARYRSLPRE